jgi:predicted component of viral defense system (DUF524 family)
MPELATFKTSHFECVFWAKDISTSQQRLSRTMQGRNKSTPVSIIRFQPSVVLVEEGDQVAALDCGEALFFENKQYDVEFIFAESLREGFSNKSPRVLHRLKNIEDSFHYTPRNHSLRATVNTANDIGWFRIELEYPVGGRIFSQAISIEILPTKIDMASDLNRMNDAIDAHYPLWRFALTEKTQQQFSAVKKPRPQFLLLWLAQFENLRQEFEKGLKNIVNAPHSRLISFNTSVSAEKLTGKLNPKLQLSVRQAQINGDVRKRFLIKKKKLSINTPENQFIKSVIKTSIKKLSAVERLAKKNVQAPDAQRLSDSFFERLGGWQASMRHFQYNSMFKEVGEFTGLSRESLVLQQKQGYAKVYRVWQELKWYLNLLGSDASLSLRNVAELYEIWCFLEIRRILISLGFEEVNNHKALLTNQGLGVSMTDGFGGAFSFKRKDGIRLRLAHEPLFKTNTRPIKTWTTAQKPDVVLEATFEDGAEFIWLFDAKYRLSTNEEQDLVPDDAINQLHRYRDALIHSHKSTTENYEKSRPVFGVYALFPGYYDQSSEDNPYQQAINEIGIGAFSLLPADDQSGSYWLEKFLKQKLGPQQETYSIAVTDKYYVEEAVRIPYKGTSTAYYSDLTIAVNGLVTGRSEIYREGLEQGNAQYYHMQLLASERQKIEQHIIKEARYLAIAVTESPAIQKISFLYPILEVEQKKRSELTEQQTGTHRVNNPNVIYWLFKLGAGLKLGAPVHKAFSRKFEVKLTSAASFSTVENWNELPLKYQMLHMD